MGRLLTISDIHGCLDEFNMIVEKVGLTKKDKLIILGDNIDRGNNNMGVIFKIIQLKNAGYNIVNLMGNHEEMFLHSLKLCRNEEEALHGSYRNILIKNGTMSSLLEFYKLKEMDRIEIKLELKSYKNFHVEDNYLFVHAGISPHIPLNLQVEDDLLWIREGFVDKESHGLPYTVVFGHTPTHHLNENGESKVWEMNDKIGIDCGCVYGRKLACLDITNNKEYYVDKIMDCSPVG